MSDDIDDVLDDLRAYGNWSDCMKAMKRGEDAINSLRAALAAEKERAEKAESERDDTKALIPNRNATGATPRPTEAGDWWAIAVLERRARRAVEKDRDAAIARAEKAEKERADRAEMELSALGRRHENALLEGSLRREEREAAIARAEAAEKERDRLSGVIERDRTKAAEIIAAARTAVAKRSWLAEGRGSYAYNDERYQAEFGAAISELLASLEPLGVLAADWSDCPKDFQGARINWKERAEAAEALLRRALDHIDACESRLDHHDRGMVEDAELRTSIEAHFARTSLERDK